MQNGSAEQSVFNGVWQVWLPGLSIAVNESAMQTSLKRYDENSDGILGPEDFSDVPEDIRPNYVALRYLQAAREAGFESSEWNAEDIVEMGRVNLKLIKFAPNARALLSRTKEKCVEYCYLKATSSENWDYLTGLYGEECNKFVDMANDSLFTFSQWLEKSPLQPEIEGSCIRLDLPRDIPSEFREEISSIIELGAFFTFHFPEKKIFSGDFLTFGSNRIEVPMKAVRYFVYSDEDSDELRAYQPLLYYMGLECDFE